MTEHAPRYLCPECGYDLNQPESVELLTCPECGCFATRAEAASRIQPREVRRFYMVSAALLIGPTLVPNAILLTDFVFPRDLYYVAGTVWVFCVPIPLLGFSAAVFLAYRRSAWEYRRRISPRVLLLIFFLAVFSGGGWYPAYMLARWMMR